MPVYEEKKKINGQKRYYILTYVRDENGNSKRIMRRNKNWIGKNGYFLAQQEEIRLKNQSTNNFEYENHTLNKLYDSFILYKEKNVKYSTLLKLQQNYDNHIKNFLGSKKYYSLTTLDIQKWKDFMYNKNLSLNTMKNTFTTLSSILEYGCEYYGLPKNVARIAKNFKQTKGVSKNEMNFITKEQFDKAIELEPNFIYQTALTILFYTGMRRGEMLSLNINDLDFENNTIRIDETINPKISNIPNPPKTNKSNRTIQVLPKIMNMIKEIINNGILEDGYIFLHNIKLTTLKAKCDRMLTKIGLKKDELIRIHDLRHSFASMCINKGVEIQIISEYMGHENISITWDTYGHLYPNSQSKLLEKIDK